MTITPESGEGVQGANTYCATAYITNYWAARTSNPLAATWAAASSALKDSANLEAASYLDAVYAPFYRGVRRGWAQGMQFPRSDAFDDSAYPLPDLPECLKVAVAELAARAVSGPLQADINAGTRVRSVSEQVGPVKTDTEYFDAGMHAPKVSYGVVSDLLAPILNGSQPGAPNSKWSWG